MVRLHGTRPSFFTLAALIALFTANSVLAQTGGGSVRGYVKDEQGGVLPGAVVTAKSPSAPTPTRAITDNEGLYRLSNLAPGTYAIGAELSGFAPFVRENVIVGAGLNLDVEIVMRLGSVSEAVTVSGETPLLEVSKPGQSVNVSSELAESVPLAARRHWSEYLRFTPGAVVNDGTQNVAATFYFHGAGFNSYETTIDGSDMSSAENPWPGYSDLPAGTIADTQIGTSGLDAATPLGFGEASNVVTKSGTDTLHGEGNIAYTPHAWTGVNTPGGTSQFATLTQPEGAVGGPIARGKWWYFGSFRYRSGTFGIGRPATQVTSMEAIDQQFTPFDKNINGPITFVKVTGQLSAAHRVETFFNHDSTTYDQIGSFNTGNFEREFIGGSGASGRVVSVWNSWFTSQVGLSWNNKTFGDTLASMSVPSIEVFQKVMPSSGQLAGVTELAQLQNDPSVATAPYSKWNFRADFTAHRDGWQGTHDIQFGTWLEHNSIKNITGYPNNGFAQELAVLTNPNNPAGGYVPFEKIIYSAGQVTSSQGTFDDDAYYVQDTWRPRPRLSITGGLRVDQIRRHDDIFQTETQNSTNFGPRVGVNYLLTSDQRDTIHASFMRVADAASINQLLFATGSVTLQKTQLFSLGLDGNFNTSFVTPASTAANPALVYDPNYSQPIVDEWTVGYRRQLPGELMVDIGFIHRNFLDRPALVEQNGIYNGNVFQGYSNVNQNAINLLTNDVWNWPVYKALELVVTKQSHQFQILGSFTHSWSCLAGTWQPRDPASFIQPNAFPFCGGLGSNDNRSAASGNGLTAGTGDPGWTRQQIRIGAVYRAPWQIVLALNYSRQSGLSSGPILTQVAAPDPQFGPPTVTLSNGRVVSNPLATLVRFADPTRSDGQYTLPALNITNFRIGREFPLGRNRRLGVNFDVFNVGNLGDFQGFLSGANQLFSANYGMGGNVQQPISAQLSAHFIF